MFENMEMTKALIVMEYKFLNRKKHHYANVFNFWLRFALLSFLNSWKSIRDI